MIIIGASSQEKKTPKNQPHNKPKKQRKIQQGKANTDMNTTSVEILHVLKNISQPFTQTA